MSGLKFVFCEGGDDLAVAKGVSGSIGLESLRIEAFLGKNKLRLFLRDVQKRPEFVQNKVAAIGIIRDADEDGSGAFQMCVTHCARMDSMCRRPTAVSRPMAFVSES